MDFMTFKERMHPLGCFNINQVLLWEADFNRNNLTRWCHKGFLVNHLLFRELNADRILQFAEVVRAL